MAVDAATGKPSEGFGRSGVVEIGVPWNGVPVVFKNIVMLGATVGEVPDGPPGDTRAYDARDGKKLWEFHTVPRPGEFGNDTWLNDGWKSRSGVNIWGWYMTVDEARNIVYMPVAGPAANYWGGDRPGNNLFANSMVAVDATTGKYKWHFQTVHHDLWDSDMPSPPTLVDIRQNGRTIPALASVGKTGYMFILNRETGKPIFGVEERPVPKGDVPGEWYSPTQPFPVKPPALTRVEFNKERDMVTAEDTSAEHVKACQELWDKSGGFYNAGPFTPFMFHEEGAPPKSTIQFPGGTGGVNWGGPAADPTTGYVFVNAHDTSLVGWIEKVQARTELWPRHGRVEAALRSRQRERRRAVLHVQRADARRDRPRRRQPAVPASAMGDGLSPSTRTPATSRGKCRSASPTRCPKASRTREAAAAPVRSRPPAASLSSARRTIGASARSTRRPARNCGSRRCQAQGNANPITYTGKNGKQYVAIVATDSLQVFALP